MWFFPLSLREKEEEEAKWEREREREREKEREQKQPTMLLRWNRFSLEPLIWETKSLRGLTRKWNSYFPLSLSLSHTHTHTHSFLTHANTLAHTPTHILALSISLISSLFLASFTTFTLLLFLSLFFHFLLLFLSRNQAFQPNSTWDGSNIVGWLNTVKTEKNKKVNQYWSEVCGYI